MLGMTGFAVFAVTGIMIAYAPTAGLRRDKAVLA